MMDWRIAPRHVVSLRSSWNAFDIFFSNRVQTLVTGAPTSASNFICNARVRPIQIVADAVAPAKLRYVDRGAHVTKDYGDLYPSLN